MFIFKVWFVYEQYIIDVPVRKLELKCCLLTPPLFEFQICNIFMSSTTITYETHLFFAQ